MEQDNPTIWRSANVFILRAYALWLIFVFLFISNFLETYHFKAYINRPFFSVTTHLIRFAAHFGGQKPVADAVQFRDYYWTYVTLFIYLIIAIIAALVWTIRDKGKKAARFFDYVWIFARYYLATILLGYGISKLLGDQFGQPDYAALIRPLGDFDARNLFWEFMGASKSYQVFGGVLETAAGLLLLFRRTTTLGGLIAISLFINVLMLDIGYDVFVKIRVIYFLLVNVFILIPDLKKLFAIFILNRGEALTVNPLLVENKKYKGAQYMLKAGLIILIVFIILRKQFEVYGQYHQPSQGSIAGIYSVKQFYLNNKIVQADSSDSKNWSKIAINSYFPILSIKLANDSITDYAFKADTLKHFVDVIPYNKSTPKFRLNYKNTSPGEWVFVGVVKNDSIKIITKKMMGKSFILQKGYGKSRWDYEQGE